MGNKPAVQRSQSNGPGQQILVQQHQQRMNRRASEFKCRSGADLTDRPSLTLSTDPSRMNRRRSSAAAQIAQRNGTNKPKRLAPRQRNLIIKSWNRMAKNKIGKDIFSAIFTEAEELKTVFGIDKSLKAKKLRADPKFISHSDLFIDTFDFVIRNLDDISMVTENAEQLGKTHADFRIENFRPEYWSIFTECIVECVANQMDKETQIAWRQLVLTLIFYMKLGYERESLRLARNNTSKRCQNSSSNNLKDLSMIMMP